MQIRVNGQKEDVPAETTIAALIERHRLTPDKVAIELNKRLVRGANYSTMLEENDEIEIVTFVGGG